MHGVTLKSIFLFKTTCVFCVNAQDDLIRGTTPEYRFYYLPLHCCACVANDGRQITCQ